MVTRPCDRRHRTKFALEPMLFPHSTEDVFMSDQLTLSIVGSGGDGAVAAGDIAANACAGAGLHVIKTEAYGPQIRGGESSCTVRVSAKPIFAQAGEVNALVIFSWSDFARFASEIAPASDAVVFY